MRIAGRYRVEATLGRGGMGEVLRVVDEPSGHRVALKRLTVAAEAADAKAESRLLFEREYHALARLQHPRIIEVYDYGVDAEQPYYTMELLEGADLHELAPLASSEACRHLRDVSTSLALLHARRMLHRDLAPRNVRLTAEGRVKLIDFGALGAFGMQRDIIGTPPMIAPEALRGMPLDQRADLFGLGALMYWALTRKHAFPARRIRELPEAWRQTPAPPSSFAPGVPPALDELVMSLLALDPLARPASAAEIIDRLNAIAELEPEADLRTVQSYVPDSALVARERELDRLVRALDATARGRGAARVIEGPRGIGKTRLLTECALEAQVRGIRVVQVNASERDDPDALVRLLARRLLETVPGDAREALAPHLGVLAPLLPPRFADDAPAEPPGGDAAETRARVMSAFRDWVVALATRGALLVLFDDVQAAGETAAGLVAMIAYATRGTSLAVVASVDGDVAPRAPDALAALRRVARSIAPGPLAEGDIGDMLESLFGDVPHRRQLARWLRDTSGGNPGQTLELTQHLVRERTIQYIGGSWVLPQALERQRLPASFDDMARARLALLDVRTRGFAASLALVRGALSLDMCVALTPADERGETFARLEELVAHGVLVGAGEGYRLAQEPLRAKLVEDLDAAARRPLHLAIAEVLLAREAAEEGDRAEAGHHLWHAGEERRAAELLARYAADYADRTDRLRGVIPALETALESYRSRGHPVRECLPLQLPLVVSGMYVDRRLAERYGDETLDVLSELTGLARGAPPAEVHAHPLCVALLTCAVSLVSVAQACGNVAAARRVVELTRPFASLPPTALGSVCHRFCLGLLHTTRGAQADAYDVWCDLATLLQRSDVARSMPESVHTALFAGALNARGMQGAARLGDAALDDATTLERTGYLKYRVYAAQIRMLHHAFRGEAELAAREHRHAEILGLQGAGTWRARAWLPLQMVMAHRLSGDLLGLRRDVEHLQTLSEEIPSLGPCLDTARLCHAERRGRSAEAVRLYEGRLARMAPGDFMLWSTARAACAEACNALGEHVRARDLCEATLALLDERERSFVVVHQGIERALAVAEAAMGDTVLAARRLDALLGAVAGVEQPLILGLLHRDRARVARIAGDAAAERRSAAEMSRLFRATGNPVLVAQCDPAGGRRTTRRPRT